MYCDQLKESLVHPEHFLKSVSHNQVWERAAYKEANTLNKKYMSAARDQLDKLPMTDPKETLELYCEEHPIGIDDRLNSQYLK